MGLLSAVGQSLECFEWTANIIFENYAVKNLFGFLGVLYSMSAHDMTDLQPKYHVTYNEDGVTKCDDTM